MKNITIYHDKINVILQLSSPTNLHELQKKFKAHKVLHVFYYKIWISHIATHTIA